MNALKVCLITNVAELNQSWELMNQLIAEPAQLTLSPSRR